MSGYDYAGSDAEVRAWAIEAMTELGPLGCETMLETVRRVNAERNRLRRVAEAARAWADSHPCEYSRICHPGEGCSDCDAAGELFLALDEMARP